MEPASWIVEDDRGDPQKGFPCGGSNTDYGKPSYAVTQAVGGSKVHLKVQETIYHPGHYRVALAVNSPAELPVDPKAATEAGPNGQPRSLSGEIMNPVAIPVLADGLFPHQAKLDAQCAHMQACFDEAVKRFPGSSVQVRVERSYGAMHIADDAPIMRLVRAAAARAGRSIESAGMGGGCDANILNHRGFEVGRNKNPGVETFARGLGGHGIGKISG